MKHEWLERLSALRASGRPVTVASLRQEGQSALAAELADASALALQRQGKRLDACVAALAEVARTHAASAEPGVRAQAVAEHARLRQALVEARWEMKVLREALQLRGGDAALNEFWPVPPKL